MKHNSILKNFLSKYINIDEKRLENARKKVNPNDGTLITFIENNLKDGFIGSLYQGSFSYGAIIKPNPNEEGGKYDVDVAVKLKYKKEYEQLEYKYHEDLIRIFKNSDRYKDKLDESKERAVRIQYDSNDGEFYVDLVPMFYDGEYRKVINKRDNTTEISGGTEFRDWVNEQNNKTSTEESKSKYLKETIRIFKYLKNQTNPDLIRSVQLTLLLSRQVDKIESSKFSDLTTTFYYIIKELKSELDSIDNVSELDLSNPGLEEEKFDRKFDDIQFADFKNWILSLYEKYEKAYNEANEEESLNLWQDIFGEDFIDSSINKNLVLYDYNHAQDISSFGWIKSAGTFKINIVVLKYTNYNLNKQKYIISGEKVERNMILEFYAKLKEYLGHNCQLYWQITNENNHFVKNRRGEINNESERLGYIKNKNGYGIKEHAFRKGRHWVKCFLVKDNRYIIGESDRFLVNIM